MAQPTLDLTGTRLAQGAALLRLFYNPIADIVYVLLLLMVGSTLWFSAFTPLLFPALFLFFVPVLALYLYLRSTFVKNVLPRWRQEDAEFLSFDVYGGIKNPREVCVRELADAALRTSGGKFIAREAGREPEDFLRSIHHALEGSGDGAGAFLSAARRVMERAGKPRIDAGVILATLVDRVQGMRDMLDVCDLAQEDFVAIVQWEAFHARVSAREPPWSPRELLKLFGGVGRSWVMGYTDELDRLTDDMSAHVLWKAERSVRIHEQERKDALRILEKSQLHDLLIVGKVGVGKKTLIENIAYDIRKQERSQFQEYTRVLVLRTAELLSGVAAPDQFLLHALKKAQESGRFFLVIHDLALMLKSGGDTIRAILMKFIREENIQLIGVMDTQDYHRYVKSDPALDHFFEKLTIDEGNPEETMAVMMEHVFKAQDRYKVHVTFKALRSVLHLTQRYLPSQAFPGKAVAVLEDAMALAHQAKDTFVGERHIREIVSQKGRIDVTELREDDREKVLNLGERMRRKIVGQEDAIQALSHTLKRAVTELHEENKPLGTFLFLGPTGVGKTHMAKVLAEEYFGSTESMIRLDMNEFSTERAVEGIVGGAQGSESELARRVQDQPFSLVLLDEIEKAHPKVINLFLQILDEGTLIDANGVKTDFRNTIIIATSNAGALFVRDFFRANAQADHVTFKRQLMEYVLKSQIFSPEFINRFDEVILFHPLSKDEAMHVAIIMLDQIVTEMRDKKGIDVKVEEEVVRGLVEKGYSREFGAREMRRTIVSTIENRLADYMLKNDVKRGEEVVIRKES